MDQSATQGIDTSQADPAVTFQLYGNSGSLSGRSTSLTLADIDAGL